MRLDFNVLWVDDQQSQVESLREAIETDMRREGFKLEVLFKSSVGDAVACLDDCVFKDHVDLILMDYDLGNGPKGDEGLQRIRDIIPYKDIIFYSSLMTVKLKKIVKDKALLGIYSAPRHELPEIVIELFNMLVKKVLDIDHYRGIVMGTTSEIDGFINNALLKIFSNGNDDHKKNIFTIISEQLKEIKENFKKTHGKAKTADNLEELFKLHGIYSSAKRVKLLRKYLASLEEHKGKCEKIKEYETEIMPARNDLAHISVKRDGFKRQLVTRTRILSSEAMRELRVKLLDHHEFFERLANDLSKRPT